MSNDFRSILKQMEEITERLRSQKRPPTPEEAAAMAAFMKIATDALQPIFQSLVEAFNQFMDSLDIATIIKSLQSLTDYEGHIPGVDTSTHWANGMRRLLKPEEYERLKREMENSSNWHQGLGVDERRRRRSPEEVANDAAVEEEIRDFYRDQKSARRAGIGELSTEGMSPAAEKAVVEALEKPVIISNPINLSDVESVSLRMRSRGAEQG